MSALILMHDNRFFLGPGARVFVFLIMFCFVDFQHEEQSQNNLLLSDGSITHKLHPVQFLSFVKYNQ